MYGVRLLCHWSLFITQGLHIHFDYLKRQGLWSYGRSHILDLPDCSLTVVFNTLLYPLFFL